MRVISVLFVLSLTACATAPADKVSNKSMVHQCQHNLAIKITDIGERNPDEIYARIEKVCKDIHLASK